MVICSLVTFSVYNLQAVYSHPLRRRVISHAFDIGLVLPEVTELITV